MRRLIVNADDLGWSPARSHGIFEAFEQGIVTNATLIVNGADAAGAAKRARERGLPTGLHLNFTDGSPVSKESDVGSLLEANGYFLDRQRQRAALDRGEVDPEHIRREARAQIEWFLDHHGAPTHLDGHHHIHVHPTVAAELHELIGRYGIRFVRIPEEPLPPPWEIPVEQTEAIERIGAQARAARELFAAHGIGSTDHFRGMAMVGHASKKAFRAVMSRLPEGVTELMVHPGHPVPGGMAFDADPQRMTELQMLTDPLLPSQLAERRISLVSYADL